MDAWTSGSSADPESLPCAKRPAGRKRIRLGRRFHDADGESEATGDPPVARLGDIGTARSRRDQGVRGAQLDAGSNRAPRKRGGAEGCDRRGHSSVARRSGRRGFSGCTRTSKIRATSCFTCISTVKPVWTPTSPPPISRKWSMRWRPWSATESQISQAPATEP